MEPETQYARSGDVRVAYQIVGDGPRDLVLVPGYVSNIELTWEHPGYERFMRRLASFARVIVFDKRGSGLSDPVDQTATIEERMDDIRAVMDAAGSARADVFGWSEGANIAAVFGASRPDRVSALVLYGAFPRGTPDEGYPWAIVPEAWELSIQEDEEEIWGQGFSLLNLAPTKFEDEALVRWWGRFERQSMSPRMARAGDSPRHEHRHPRCRAEHPCSNARHPLHRGCSAGRGRALARASTSQVHSSSSCRATTIGPGPRTGTTSSTRSRSSSPASAAIASPTACSLRCSSPTSSAPPSAPRRSGDRRWVDLLERHDAVVRKQLRPVQRTRDRHRR